MQPKHMLSCSQNTCYNAAKTHVIIKPNHMLSCSQTTYPNRRRSTSGWGHPWAHLSATGEPHHALVHHEHSLPTSPPCPETRLASTFLCLQQRQQQWRRRRTSEWCPVSSDCCIVSSEWSPQCFQWVSDLVLLSL